MFALKLIKKLVLFPVLVLILIAKLTCKVAVDLSSYVVGPLMFFVAGCDIYCLIKARIQDVLILSMILVTIFLVLVFAAVVEGTIDGAKNAVRRIMG